MWSLLNFDSDAIISNILGQEQYDVYAVDHLELVLHFHGFIDIIAHDVHHFPDTLCHLLGSINFQTHENQLKVLNAI